MSKILKISSFFCTLLVLSCNSIFYGSQPGAREYHEMDKLSAAQNTARINKFSSYPIEKQIDIYLYAECCVEGGGITYLTVDGEKKIACIANRIENSGKTRDKFELVKALFFINRECKCMKKYPEVIRRLEIIEENLDAEKSSSDENYDKFFKDYI